MIQPDKINIAYFCAGSIKGGAENVLLEFVKNLDTDRFSYIWLLTPNEKMQSELKKQKMRYNVINVPDVILDVRRFSFSMNPFTLMKYIILLLPVVKQIRKVIMSEKIHILHTNNLKSHLIGAVCCIFNRCRLLWHMHDLIVSKKILKIFKSVERMFVDEIAAVSSAALNQFSRVNNANSKYDLLYNGIDIGEFENVERTNERSNSLLIGCAGILSEMKGQEYLIKAVPELVVSGIDFKVKIIGEESNFSSGFTNQLKTLTKECRVEKYIEFHGYSANIKNVFAEFDILVLPTLLESFGMVLIEAGALCIPVVASRTGGCVDIVEDGKTGLLVPPGDSSALSEALLKLMNNKELRYDMGQNAKEKVRTCFDMKNQTGKLESIYIKLTEN